MHEISKNKEPNILAKYRMVLGSVFDGGDFTVVKDAIKKSLLDEQGYTCAYCMNGIKASNMKVEHWASRKTHPNLQLTYTNLLGCCKGNEGEPKENQCCDTRKGNSPIKYSPAEPNDHINKTIIYLGDGRIKSNDISFNEEINLILNLNLDRQVKNRLEAIIRVKRSLAIKDGNRSQENIVKMISKINKRNGNNKFIPYYGIMLHYLSKKLRG
ncbi:retron system putative HNH endonuclease [Shewanella benthica]|uniref:TIGR02646 family protein n=1 Tax=Shewanella benthica KT99 TaxID=314608 RepID=A9CWI4_9GAMM|nr:retron system putative HNH endonuclease [Shewanella benthica]EDQ02531.1 hypothetical protein KT99_18477 [Shewanella benthica KT99]